MKIHLPKPKEVSPNKVILPTAFVIEQKKTIRRLTDGLMYFVFES